MNLAGARQEFIDKPDPWSASRYLVAILENDLPVPDDLKPWVANMISSYAADNRRAVKSGADKKRRVEAVAMVIALTKQEGLSQRQAIKRVAGKIFKSEETIKDWIFRTNKEDVEIMNRLADIIIIK